MRIYTACILICMSVMLILVMSGCTRELGRAGETPQRPFNFERIPVDDQPAQLGDGTQVSGGETEGVNGEGAPVDPPPPSVDPALESLLNSGRNSIMEGDWEGAIEAFLEVIERDETNTIALYNLGLSYRRTGDPETAIEYARRAVESDPDRLYVHQGLGFAYLENGNVESAMIEFEEELDRHPDEKSIANVAFELAKLKLESGLNEEAFDAALKAVQLLPEDANNHAILGEVYMSNGAHEQAMESFTKAVDIGPDQAIFRKLMGDALWELDRLVEARSEYEDAIILDETMRELIPSERLDGESETVSSHDSPM